MFLRHLDKERSPIRQRKRFFWLVRVRQDLLDYERDTWAMVKLLEKLRGSAKGRDGGNQTLDERPLDRREARHGFRTNTSVGSSG